MTTSPNYQLVLQEATRKRCIAELRLTSTTTLYQAAAMEEDSSRCEKLRSEIHALQDIILDCISTQMHCIMKING